MRGCKRGCSGWLGCHVVQFAQFADVVSRRGALGPIRANNKAATGAGEAGRLWPISWLSDSTRCRPHATRARLPGLPETRWQFRPAGVAAEGSGKGIGRPPEPSASTLRGGVLRYVWRTVSRIELMQRSN